MKNQDEHYKDWCEELKKWQQSDLDQRQQAREADYFLLEKDGQWEPNIAARLDAQKRPRYTFDKVTPIIETMMSDVENMEFGCNVKPDGNGSAKDVAETFEGMIRTIQNMSRFDSVTRRTARRLMRRGFDAWIVKAKYKDEWSFDQDLFIEAIPNSINRVWVSDTCTKEDSSDSNAAYVLTSLSKEDYKRKFPNGKCISVDDSDMSEDISDYEPEVVTIAERYYRKEAKVEIAQLTNGQVIELDERWEKVKDEYASQGIKIERQKTVNDFKWYHCAFDGGGILTEPKLTVFRSNPVITLYGNYEHLGKSSKITYSGIVLKEMDAQRVHNYAKSREIEEGALAPRAKWMMTKKQAAGHEAQLANMNISADPVQFYNHDEQAPPPFYAGGAQVNPHLANLGNQMAIDIKEQANVFGAMQGEFAGRMSEDAVRMQIDRGTAATRKWINPLINGIRRACELLVEAIPVVYDTRRQFTIMNMDGTEEDVMLNDEIYDQQSGTMVRMNNLNAGKYKVVCDAGPAFTNRLEAGLNALLEYAKIDPSIVMQGGDIMLKSIDAPLVDKIAERKRAMMLQQGMIPFDQMTEEEQAQMQQQMAMQAQQPNTADILAQAEAQARIMEGQAAMQNEINDANKLMIDQQKADNDTAKVQIEAAKAGVDIDKTLAETEGKKIDNLQKAVGTAMNMAQRIQ